MKLLKNNDSLLRQPCEPFDFRAGVEVDGKMLSAIDLFELLKKVMCENRGLGLSACQIGIMKRVFVIGNPTEPDSVISVFNPKIVNTSSDMGIYEEGCLSFPGLFIRIKRPIEIRARYADHTGKTDTSKFSGLTSRVFQHECDHLDGIVYTQRANLFHVERAKRQMKKLDRLKNANAKRKRVVLV